MRTSESDQEGAAIEGNFAGLRHHFHRQPPTQHVPLDNGTLLIMLFVVVVVEVVFTWCCRGGGHRRCCSNLLALEAASLPVPQRWGDRVHAVEGLSE